jgi:Bacterial Ig-like domain (group 1)
MRHRSRLPAVALALLFVIALAVIAPSLSFTRPVEASSGDPGQQIALPASLDRADSQTASITTGAPTFGQPTISGIQGVGFEQDIRLDPRASLSNPANPRAIYTSVPGSLSSDTSWIWRSLDGGRTFKWIPAATPTEGKVDPSCAGGGDTELAVDANGHLYFADLTLANFSTARSDNQGQTLVACSNTGVPDAVVDRQWYATDGDPTAGGNIYLVNDEIGPGAPSCPVSGFANNVLVMYRSPAPSTAPGFEGIEFGPPNRLSGALTCNEGIMGNDEVSPVATKTDSNGQPTLAAAVRHIYVVHDDASLSKILMGRCFPVPFGPPTPNVSDPSGLSCVDLAVTSFPGFKTGGNFPTMAIDKAGNLYAVWEQAPVDSNGNVTGDTLLKYSSSTDEGKTWSTPTTIPTGGLHNNVFAWPAAGDDGRVDIAFYGTPATANPNDPSCGTNNGGRGGPDATTNGIWSLYMVQTLNGHAAAPTFTAPILAGEHYIHKGTIQTLIGGQCGDRTLGDFLQLRVGQQGEAQISFADSNTIAEAFAPHGMYVRQNGGTGVFASIAVTGDPIIFNTTTDPSGDGRYEAAGVTSANFSNLDILESSMSKPAASDCHPAGTPCYRVKMTLNNLSLLPPGPPDADTDLVWLTQWFVPADPGCTQTNRSCTLGGKKFFVYAESTAGALVRCFSGENMAQLVGGGVTMTYPGKTQITAVGACSVVTGANGKITIDVPISQVSLEDGTQPLSSTLFSVTASTMTLAQPANCCPSVLVGIGGTPFNLIDVARAYDANFTLTTGAASLSLAPQTATNTVGSQHCVTATVTTASGAPSSGVTVVFDVSGANPAHGTSPTNASGQAQFCYTGIATGNDSIKAFADVNNSGTQDPGEPSDTASKTWVAPPTNCEANITQGGQITTDHGDVANFGGNASGLLGTASGQEQYLDHGPAEPLNVHSTSVVSITCNAARTTASIFGQATVDGGGSVGYEIDVQDNGEPGSNDTYRIRLSNGYDSGMHKLNGGNVQIH